MNTRRLPIRVPLRPGEAIDSWLEALAARHHATWSDLLDGIGLTQPRSTISGWIVCPTPEDTAALTGATGADPGVVAAAALARYDSRALRITPGTQALDNTFAWSPSRSSRFCPQCLAETGGRWLLRWRLGWSFACLRHLRLLVDTCTGCGQRQRRRPLTVNTVPTPGRCASPLPGFLGRIPARCGADLTSTDTVCFDTDHPALLAQQSIDDIIDTGVAAFGLYADAPQPAETALTDIKIIADRVLVYGSAASLAHIVPADLLRGWPRDPDTPRSHKPGQGFRTSAAAAVAVTAAISAFGAADAHRGGTALRWLISEERGHKPKTNASTLRRTTASPVLDAIQLAGLAPWLSPLDQLRYRLADPMPRRPFTDTTHASKIAHRLPTMLWPTWSLRLAIAGPQQRQLRPAVSVALLLTGTNLPIAQASDLLGGHVDNPQTVRILRLLGDCPQWEAIRAALSRMADYLAETTTPIDYQRRRGLDYTPLLPDSEWQRICRAHGTPTIGVSGTAIRVRCWLFERLSGLPADTFPDAPTHNHHRNRTAEFARHLTPELVHDLHAHARKFLTAHAIHDEPPTWQPPAHLLAELALPADDPTRIDIDRLHQLIRTHDHTPGRAAETLGTNIEVVRHLLEIHPAPRAPRTSTKGSAYPTAKAALGPEELADLYLRQRRSIAEIAARIGVADHVIARLARDYNIAVRPAGRQRTTHVDRDWLHQQYVQLGRPLSVLAREQGLTYVTMANWAARHNIPIRHSRDYHQRRNLPTAAQLAAAPRLLRPVLAEIGGADRLDEFAIAASHPNLDSAADAIGIHPATLRNHIKALEQHLGGPLINRARGAGRQMTLTPFGRNVLDAIRIRTQQTDPDHPEEMPSN